MHIALIMPAYSFGQDSPPLGIMYLSAVLKKEGHSVRLLCCNKKNKDDFHEAVKEADIVGVSLTSQVVAEASELVKDIRTLSPKSKIIAGGPHVYLFEQEVFDQLPGIDYACIGEGEYVMLELANKQSLEKIDGLLWKDGSDIHKNKKRDLIEPLDRIPMPDRDGIRISNFALRGSIMTSRGCPSRCAYCVKIFDRKYRSYSPDYVLNEMEIMYHKYSIRDFVVNDDNFAADIERAYTIGDMIAKKNWKDITIRLGNGIRADTVVRYPDFIRRYAGIGLNSVSLGIESVVQEVLDATQKDITLEQIDKAVSILKEHNLDYFLYLQVGLPNDRYENAKKVKEWVKRNDIKCFGVGLTTPYPKTALWDYIEKNGRFLYPKNEIYKRYPWHNLTNVFPVWETKEFSAEKRMRALTELRYFAGMRFLRYGGIIALFRHPAILEWARKWVRYAVFGRIFGKK